ncbi:MAG TPA: hypothetical protein DCQ31_19135 [Bacteroidales bacterium]|nr:hypothetical protein [Bacteroidales bacterium]
MRFFKRNKPKKREVFLSKESGNDFPLDKRNRPLICKEEGDDACVFNAMSSKSGKDKIELKPEDFEGNVKIKEQGSFLNIEDDFEISNNFKRRKIGVYLGKFKEDLEDYEKDNENTDNTDEIAKGEES